MKKVHNILFSHYTLPFRFLQFYLSRRHLKDWIIVREKHQYLYQSLYSSSSLSPLSSKPSLSSSSESKSHCLVSTSFASSTSICSKQIMVVLRYLKSYIGDGANRYEQEKQRRWRRGAGGGELAVGIIFSRSMTLRCTPQPERLELIQQRNDQDTMLPQREGAFLRGGS